MGALQWCGKGVKKHLDKLVGNDQALGMVNVYIFLLLHTTGQKWMGDWCSGL